MLVRVLTKKVVLLFCVLMLVTLGQSNATAQIDWGRVLDLSPKNTETKPERPSLDKQLELGRQLREQNDAARARAEGRGSNQGAAVNAPNIEMRGVFERDRGGPDRDYSSNQSSQRYSAPNQSPQQYPGGNSRAYRISRGTELNRAEIFLYSQNPDLIPVVDYYRRVAEAETERRFGASRGDDASDAFRHAYWSALLSRSLGPYTAKVITDAHEMTTPNRPDRRFMDLHNNSVGIGIGQRYPNRGLDERGIANLTERALQNGWLVILKR